MSSFRALARSWNMPLEHGRDPTTREVLAAAKLPDRESPFVKEKRQRTLELTDLRLPAEALPKGEGRGRTFEIRVVPTRTVELTELHLLFNKFAELNKKYERDVLFMLFMVDIVVQELKPSSAITYGRTLISAFSREGKPLVSPLVKDTFDILELLAAEDDAEHARDISEQEGWELVRILQGDAKIIAFLQVVVGPRVADLEYILKGDIKFHDDGRMTLYFRRTKNRRHRGARYAVVVRPANFPAELLGYFVGQAEHRLFAKPPTVEDFNNALKAACRTLEMEACTSYSLRRMFIHSVIKKATTGDVIDWLAVIRSTGHHSLEVIRCSYAQKFDSVL